MIFDESQVLGLFSRLPYWRLMRQPEARRFVDLLVRDGEELAGALHQFPETRYEQLDSHYHLLSCLGAMDEDLIADLCTHYAWQGVVWAAWLCVLAPDPRYRRHLLGAGTRAPHNRWLIELALCENDEKIWPADAPMQAQARRLRAILAEVTPCRVVLRRRPVGFEACVLRRESAEVTRAYRSGGLPAARAVIEDSRVLRFHLNR